MFTEFDLLTNLFPLRERNLPNSIAPNYYDTKFKQTNHRFEKKLPKEPNKTSHKALVSPVQLGGGDQQGTVWAFNGNKNEGNGAFQFPGLQLPVM